MNVSHVKRNAARVIEGFCWCCEVELEREANCFGSCPNCRRRFRVGQRFIEEWMPMDEVVGKMGVYVSPPRIVVAKDGTFYQLEADAGGWSDIPEDVAFSVARWAIP